MNWFLRLSQNEFIGYKVVAFNPKQNSAYSLYDKKITIDLTIGSVNHNTYLGTSRQFCIDYYTGGTDDQDMLLTYRYQSHDVLEGEPNHHNGEVKVKQATLVNVEMI